MKESDTKRLNIKQWATEDRPREKMLAKGLQALSDAELLAILIGSGNKGETAVELGRRILAENHQNLNELARLSPSDMRKRFKGIGTAKAVTIAAALELGRRRKLHDEIERPQVTDSQQAYELFAPFLCDLPHEEMWIALLNHANKVISKHKISQGGLTATMVDVQLIMKLALEHNATQLLLAHNHPSGNAIPSNPDIALTRKIKSACDIFDIKLIDHIIVAHNTKYSFADNGNIC